MLRIDPRVQRFVHKSTSLAKRRKATTREILDNLPPALPNKPLLVDSSSLWEILPVSRYWGMESRDIHLRSLGKIEDLHPPLIPRFFRKFDWVVGFEWGFADETRVPTSVLCKSGTLSTFMKWVYDRRIGFLHHSTLVVMGTDRHVSRHDKVAVDAALASFKNVYFSANDSFRPEIQTIPVALTEHYLRGFEKNLKHLVSDEVPEKTDLLLAAFGKVWPHLNSMEDRFQVMRELERKKLGRVEVFPRDEYFRRLSRSHYFIYPRGNGIQSPKGFEALMLGSIPIVTRHSLFEELEKRGMPLLILDDWRALSAKLLEDRLDHLLEKVAAFLPFTRSVDMWWDFCLPSISVARSASKASRAGLNG